MGVSKTAAAEQESRSVQFVAARLDAGLNDRATALPELSRRHAGIHAEFLDGFRWREEDDAVDEGVVVVNAVKNEIVRLRAQAVRRKRSAAGLGVTERLGVCS